MKKITVGDWKANQQTREYITTILDTGRLSYGPFCRELEQQFASIHNCQYGVLSNSGTSSLLVALQALKELHNWNDGDEVIVPSLTFVATINIVLHNNLKPVLVDIEPEYYSIDTDKIGKAITDKTRAIIPVHLFGQPANMRDIKNIASYHNMKIIEDSCETMFISQDGVMVGSHGDIGCFSTYIAHLLTTGIGGIATTNNSDYAAKMRSLVNHGRDGIYISIDDDSDKRKETISRRFNFESVGHSFRITEFEAAVGLAQLPDYHEMIVKRKLNAIRLTQNLSHLQWALQLPKQRQNNGHAYMMYPIVVRNGDKWPLIYYLENNGIETREMLPLTNQPVYRDWINEADYPIAKWVNEGGFYVGCHQYLDASDMDYIAEKIGDFYDNV